MNQIRIIGGKWGGRRVHFSGKASLRPTLDAVRETLFNWLMHDIWDTRCLDLFAGSGALGFEALSRGASFVTFVDRDAQTIRSLRTTRDQFDAKALAEMIEEDVHIFLKRDKRDPYDIIFLDPPFHKDLLLPIIEQIQAKNLLKPNGFIYFEVEKNFVLPDALKNHLHREKILGEVRFGLLRFNLSS